MVNLDLRENIILITITRWLRLSPRERCHWQISRPYMSSQQRTKNKDKTFNRLNVTGKITGTYIFSCHFQTYKLHVLKCKSFIYYTTHPKYDDLKSLLFGHCCFFLNHYTLRVIYVGYIISMVCISQACDLNLILNCSLMLQTVSHFTQFKTIGVF